nr:hypothetical protein [Tanacetum cinerariifolium]
MTWRTKYNKHERLNRRKIQREPTFQVVLDALAITSCYSAFFITANVPEVYMHQFWDFVYKYDTFYRFKIDKRKRFKLTLEVFRDIFKICPIVQVSTEEPTRKLKRVKRHAKKSTQALARGVVIRETPEIPMSKKKEKVDVSKGKRIKLMSNVALTKEAQYKEVRNKSLRDFHKTHPSGSGTATKPTSSTAIIKPSVTNKGTGDKPGVPNVTEEESSKSETESCRNDEDDSNNDQDSISDRSDQEKASDDYKI